MNDDNLYLIKEQTENLDIDFYNLHLIYLLGVIDWSKVPEVLFKIDTRYLDVASKVLDKKIKESLDDDKREKD